MTTLRRIATMAALAGLVSIPLGCDERGSGQAGPPAREPGGENGPAAPGSAADGSPKVQPAR